jgi:hypothetical protein
MPPNADGARRGQSLPRDLSLRGLRPGELHSVAVTPSDTARDEALNNRVTNALCAKAPAAASALVKWPKFEPESRCSPVATKPCCLITDV